MTAILTIAIAFLVGLAGLTTLRVVDTRASLLDRLLAGDLTISLLTFILGGAAALYGSEVYLDAALVAGLLAFVATIVLARFIGEGSVL